MNNIASKSSETRTNNIRSTRPAKSVETAGSLAMYQQHSLFETRVYDMFSTSNPFAVDYTQYSDSGETVAYTGGFLSSFSNAVSTLTSSGSFSDSSSSASTTSCGGGFSGASCGASAGGFTSVC